MDGAQIRIGYDERSSAQHALEAHLAAGRLELDEYADRFAIAGLARTRDELDALFTDLPEPHVGAAEVATVEPAAAGPAEVALTKAGVEAPAGREPGCRSAGGGRWDNKVVALMPFLAVALFFLVPGWHWEFFLLVPVAGIVFEQVKRRDRGRRRNRR